MEKITLQTKHTTYQIGISDPGYLLHLYYGPKIQEDTSVDLVYYERGMSGVPYECGADNTFSCDVLPQEYPFFGAGDYRSPTLEMSTEKGIRGVDLRYKSHCVKAGKYKLPGLPTSYGEDGVETYEILLEDPCTLIEVVLKYGVFYEEDVITRSIEVMNRGTELFYLNKVYTASLDFVTGEFDLIHFHGRHMMERILERTPIVHVKQCIESRRGTSSHQQNPFVMIAQRHTGEQSGLCYGMSLMYSGNFQVEAERDQFEQTRVQMGLSSEMLDYPLNPGEKFYAPEVLLSCTDEGLTELSHIYHNFIKAHVFRGKYKNRRRPILINNWEATYFDFTGEKIIQIGKQAKELGIEMLVLDDGWFGKRSNDKAGLGDWYVNEEKIGSTLGELSKEIHRLGLKFGLWIEPEMVNEDSDLYRAHPDWVLKIPGRKPVLGRNQLVLDFSRREVVDFVFDQISQVMDHANIEYLKMDMNRSICDVYSATEEMQNSGTISYRYVLGVYDFLERMLQRYPDLLIEGCSSGGGRFDAGMLYYTPQIWCSDNTDAIERLTIQEGTSFGYPISALSAHVSAVPNHQTGRVTSIHTRGVVAMGGNLGYELDLTQLSEEEKEIVKQQIAKYKNYWELFYSGKYYRVDSPSRDGEYGVWNFVNMDQTEALLSVVSTTTHANPSVYYARCLGLKMKGRYYCEETEKIYSGNALNYIGIPIPITREEYVAYQYHFKQVD